MRIDLLGAEFNIKTDQDPEYLAEVVDYFRRKTEEIRATVGTSDPLKTAILAGILTADDYLKVVGENRVGSIEATRIAGDLIGELDEALTPGEADTEPASVDKQSKELG